MGATGCGIAIGAEGSPLGCLSNGAVTINPDFAVALACIAATHVIEYANGLGHEPVYPNRSGHLQSERFRSTTKIHRARLNSCGFVFPGNRGGISLVPNFAEGHLTSLALCSSVATPAAAINGIDANGPDPLYRDLTLYYLAEARISLGQLDAAVAALKAAPRAQPQFGQTSLLCSHHATAISTG